MAALIDKNAWFSAGESFAEPVLRGTIYDRSLKELAVSYHLFSLFVHPAEIKDRKEAAALLGQVLEESPDILEVQLKSRQRVIELADDLDKEQAEAVNKADLPGVYCKSEEVRFYPAHTAASHVLGFVGEGIGLAGVEGRYDTLLQPGAFRKEDVQEIDLSDQPILGRKATDVVLTLDIDIQKQLEKRFRSYLDQQGAVKGMGVLLEPLTGKVLAVMNYPSFNPNYFWQADDQVRLNRVYRHDFHKALIEPIIAKAAAIAREGLTIKKMLPPTVAAPRYGVDEQTLQQFETRLGLEKHVLDQWGTNTKDQQLEKESAGSPAEDTLTGAQMSVALASLVNGGWRIAPYILEGIYDHGTKREYVRDQEFTEREHILDPASGVIVRRELFRNQNPKKGEMEGLVDFTTSHVALNVNNGLSQYLMQEFYMGLLPVKMPRYMLVMAVEKDTLLPSPGNKKKEKLANIGKDVLSQLMNKPHVERPPYPQQKNPENFHQFFISKRLDFQEPVETAVAATVHMPELIGLSLRKGLQRINTQNIRVRISGTGKIVAQDPAPGEPLASVDECSLTLQKEI
ncbi:PASTA domain-containing protein [Desulfogranum marinum]|uniref:PASTA domain-containing protein n=1 Tax=Desulfogranum marinum TaxID=453220 RepID=UPI001964FBB6|nr:PASTA domain-containing protein [Desulfogranum marinum]MBM9511076.1 hypothetical protein [Desulfogranum marinum]